MEFVLSFDQPRCLEWELDPLKGLVFDYLTKAAKWADIVNIEGESFYFCSRTVIVKNCPIVTTKTDTIWRMLKYFDQIGIIEYVKNGKQDCFRITEKGKKWKMKNSDDHPKNKTKDEKLGQPSEKARTGIRKNSDGHPTYQDTIPSGHNITHSPNGEEEKPPAPPNQKKSFGNEKINAVLEFLQKNLEVLDFKETKKMQRRWGKNIASLKEKLGAEEFIKRFDYLRFDEFHAQNCGSLEYLHKNIKSFVPKPKGNTSSKKSAEQKKKEAAIAAKKEKKEEIAKILEGKISKWQSDPKNEKTLKLLEEKAEKRLEKFIAPYPPTSFNHNPKQKDILRRGFLKEEIKSVL